MNDTTILGAIVFAILAAVGLVFRAGGKVKEKDIDHERAQDALDTHDRIDHRPPVDPSDHDDITERLHGLSGK